MDSKPPDLGGRRILITRSAEQATSMADRVRAFGGEPVLLPVVKIHFRHDLELNLEQYDHVLLPSVNAARALEGHVVRVPTLCVGERTADAVRAMRDTFVGPIQTPETFRAESMLDHLDETYGGDKNRRFLLIRGEHGRDTLAEGIRARGGNLDEVLGYEMRPTSPSADELAQAFDVATFLSGATLAAFLDVVPDAHTRLDDATVAVIGPVAQARAEALKVRVDLVPNRATVDDLLRHIADSRL